MLIDESKQRDPSGGTRAEGSEQKDLRGGIRAYGTEQRDPSVWN